MIHIFLHPHAKAFDLSQLKGWESEDYLLPFKQREYGLFPSGRAALSRILSNINLKKRDEDHSRQDDLERIEKELHEFGLYLRWFSERKQDYAALAQLFPEARGA